MNAVTADDILFDTHAHVLSDDTHAYPYSSLRGGAQPPVSPLVYPVEQLIAEMDAGGVARACLVQRATLYGYDNSYVLDAAERFPDRFASVVVLDAQDPGSPGQLRQLVRERGAAGLRIVAPTLSRDETDWLAGDEALGLWRAAAELGLPVSVILYRLNNEAGRAALRNIAQHFPTPILIDHVGLPHASTPECKWAAAQGLDYSIPPPPDFGIELLSDFADLGHVHFKVTDINFDRLEDAGHDAATFVRALADRFGALRLVWGSDVGQSPKPYAAKIARVRDAARLLSPDERAAFLRVTAFGPYGMRAEAGA
jgi:predicted TIM-barrel fold metal-dependent hydrolase